MKALRYRIELKGRVLAAGRGGDPNTVVTRPYLPGSLLRGAFIEAFPNGTDDVSLAADSDTRPLFFDGSVRYLNGYLVDEGQNASDRRMLPTPRSWHQKKDRQSQIKDFAAGEPEQAAWTPPYQTLGDPFCTVPPPGEAETTWLGQPEETLKTHHDDHTGDIYRYVSLSAGQTFEALVLCDESAQAERIVDWMGEEWRDGGRTWALGKGGTTQGRVQTQLESVRDLAQDGTWGEAPEIESAPRRLDARDPLVVTLLSDLLARGSNGQFVAGPEAITGALNRTLDAVGVDARFSAPERVYMHPSLAGGFNREWGQYLPEADAAAMGSVLVYENPSLSAETLRTLEWRGVGARRAEGFGRIAFNLHGDSQGLTLETERDRMKEGREVPDPHPFQDGTPSHAIAGQMADRMLRRQLDLALSREVETLSLNTNQVSNSQVGGLRSLIQRALLLPKKEEQAAGEDEEFDERRSLERGRDLIREYLEDIDGRTGARSRLQDAIIERDVTTQGSGGPTPLLEWTQQRVEDGTGPAEDPSIWDMLLRGEESRPAIGTVQAELTDRLVYIYNLRLAHDVLARAGENDSTDGENA